MKNYFTNVHPGDFFNLFFALIRNEKKIILENFQFTLIAFILILFTEITIKYTGISNFLLFFL